MHKQSSFRYKLITLAVALALLVPVLVGCGDTTVPTLTPSQMIKTLPGESNASPSPGSAPSDANLQGRIAFYRRITPLLYDIPSSIRVMNADGSNESETLTIEWACDPDWSPNGKKIACIMRSGQNIYDIYTMNADGSEIKRLTDGSGVSNCPDWSPDGTRIVFHSGGSRSSGPMVVPRGGFHYWIEVVNADGSGQTVLFKDSGGSWDFEARYPCWSPDGEYVAFAGTTNMNTDIYIINADGTGLTRLTDNDPETVWSFDSMPAWSPDGKYIAFVSERHGNSLNELYVMKADGSCITRLTYNLGDDVEHPAWSPDGEYIAFSTEGGSIYVISTDGSNLAHIGSGYNPSWTQ